jgi:DNA-binding transcriptional ArsR family regulator
MANGRANTSSFQGYASPNYTPVPDELFDEQLAELSGSELKVLLYVCRRTFGFKRDADNISLSQMLTGLRTRDGRVLDRGTGLSKKTLLGAIKSLEEKNIIITTRRRSVEKGDEPTAYRLNVRHTGLEHATAASREKAAPPVGEKVHQGGGGEIPPAPWGNFSPTQETDRKTEENLSSIRKVSPNVDKFDEPPASEAQHPASRHPNIEDVGTILERHNVVRHVPQQDEDYQVIQAYIVDFAREFNDQASLKISTTRA